jgi:hypothetical protein
MSEDGIEFGASDLGGPKYASPSQSTTPDAALTNELIKRKAWSRIFALVAVLVMSISALGCLGFAMYVGCHFLKGLEKHEEYSRTHSPSADQVAAHPKQGSVAAKAVVRAGSKKTSAAAKAVPPSEKEDPAAGISEKLYLSVLAPLIPASFSSALAIILFITIARFVTNFERIGKENSESEAPEDYGAIAALVQEVGKLIQTLRGK